MPVTAISGSPEPTTMESNAWANQAVADTVAACFHCGLSCGHGAVHAHDRDFCCHGCQTVYELLNDNGLEHFYDLGQQAGIRVQNTTEKTKFAHLDDPPVRERLLDFADGKTARITLRIPAIHCIACVWLLENLFKLHPGIAESRVNFSKKEVSVCLSPGKLRLSELAALLTRIGYEPEFRLADLEERAQPSASRKLYLQVGVAGFAFGNIMLFSFPAYLGLGENDDASLKGLFGVFSLLVALPALLFSAGDYWRSAWLAVRERVLTIDLPIAAGLVALYAQSGWEILSGQGVGYLDSLTGLIFFLLCGKIFQKKTYDRLVFDRDYKSFFPLAVTRKTDTGEESVALSNLNVGDRLLIRHGELIPADARLISGNGLIDYSFVTGESEPVEKATGDYLYAGGQHIGGAIEVRVEKPVSQSYLTSLWSHASFAKPRPDWLNTLTNQYSRRFIIIVAGVALAAALYWSWVKPALALKAFVSVLIVACPCALALAAPFALGTAQRRLARHGVFLKNPLVIERLARIQTIVFDKTGTLTMAHAGGVTFDAVEEAPREGGTPNLPSSEFRVYAALDSESMREAQPWPPEGGTPNLQQAVLAVARHSTHPHCVRLCAALTDGHPPAEVEGFIEMPGQGVMGITQGQQVILGSAAWLDRQGVCLPGNFPTLGTVVHVAIDGQYRGHYHLTAKLRPQTQQMLGDLGRDQELALLSGDNDQEQERFRELFGQRASLRFNQDPRHKLEFVEDLQRSGKSVLMVGDGLNDAGALKQSDIGVAVVEHAGRFSPASDVIMDANMVPRLASVLEYSRRTVRVIWLSFFISSVYNVIGLSIAAQGRLSPVVCAILMPLSSITVVAFACGATRWLGRRLTSTVPELNGGGDV